MNMNSVERIVEYASLEPEKYHQTSPGPSTHTRPHPTLIAVAILPPLSRITKKISSICGYTEDNSSSVNGGKVREALDPLVARPSTIPLAAAVPSDWPKHGEVVFQSVSLRYPSNERDVLR